MSVDLGPLTNRRFAAVIFDMDGTLVDSTPAVNRSWTRWAVEYGLTREDMAGFHGVPAATIVTAVLPERVRTEAEARINEIELAELDDVVPLPGATQALAVLGGKAAIATSCTRPLAAARIAASGIEQPQVLVTVDDVEHGKPAPDPFLLAARRLGADPRECLVVEDAPKGLIAAKAAGCATLAVVTTNRAEDLEADAVVPNLASVRFDLCEGAVLVSPA